jgi:restriction endonuclease S subunit
MYEVKPGDFILSGIDARNGAFGIVPDELDGAIVTNDFWYFEINEEIISKELFLELTATTWFDEICKRGSDGTTQRIRLQSDKFFNQTIFLPELEEQGELLTKIHLIKEKNGVLTKEIESQKSLLSQLKQSILQEAIQGKLTEEWRALRQAQQSPLEPASELLKRIQAEKARLVKEKKIKKEKPLPPITEFEKPFELPEGWEWCRLGEIADVKRGIGPRYSENGVSKMINQKCVRWFDMEVVHSKSIDKDWFEYLDENFKVRLADLLVNSTGDGTIGRSAIVDQTAEGYAFDSHVLRVRPYIDVESIFLALCINSNYGQGLIQDLKGAKSTKQTELGSANLSSFSIPVPPLEEQKAIIEKMESLMEKCRALEEEISQSEQHAQMLMQAVLKEAFEK